MDRKAILQNVEALKSVPGIAPEALDLANRIENEATRADRDPFSYRAVVVILGAVVLIVVLGGVVLAFKSSGGASLALPDAVVAMGSAAIGALAGLLAPSPTEGAG